MMKFWMMFATLLLVTPTMADLPSEEEVANAKYLGVRACRACHMSRAQGRMYRIWQHGPHAAAYDTLGSERARQVGREHGVEDPQNDPKCLRCHLTAFEVPDSLKHRRFNQTEGVGCEACHGPGEFYRNKRIMCLITAGELEGERVGLVEPTEELCVTCHNPENPTHPGPFNFEEMAQKIAHPLPEARRQRIEEEGCGPEAEEE